MKVTRSLFSLMAVVLACFLCVLAAVSACAQAPVITADGNIVVPSGMTSTQQSLMVLIGLGVPLLISLAKAEIPKLPGWSLPMLAPLLGAGADYLMGLAGAHSNGWLVGALSGAAGVGARELKDQLQAVLSDRLKLGAVPPQVKVFAGLMLLAGCLAFLTLAGGAGCTKSTLMVNGQTNIVTVIDPVKLQKVKSIVEPIASSVLRRAIHNSPQHAQEIGDYARAIGGAVCRATATGGVTPGEIEAAIDRATTGLQVANLPPEVIDAKNGLIALYNVLWDDDLRIAIPNNGWANAVLSTICDSVDLALKDSGQTGVK